MKSVWEVLVLVGLLILLTIIVLPLLLRDRDLSPRRRKPCAQNLSQIVRACVDYQEPNGDFFPAFWDGERFDPMNSLAVLYPSYLNNVKVFGCPETKDHPVLTQKDKVWSFGPVDSDKKCSYFYDELSNFVKIGPGQAMACDADGQTWINTQGTHPPYAADWKRQPRKPNHENGQYVMYFDGHAYWRNSNYASSDPDDNIFCPNATSGVQWDPDTDAYLWDGVDSRTVENRNK